MLRIGCRSKSNLGYGHVVQEERTALPHWDLVSWRGNGYYDWSTDLIWLPTLLQPYLHKLADHVSCGRSHYGCSRHHRCIHAPSVISRTILTQAVVILLPDNPMSSRLTPVQKVWAIERLRENQTGIENTQFKWHQVRECLRDPQTWMLSLITIISNVPNGAVSSYQATLIRGFGFNSKTTALLQLPSGVVSIVSILSATYLAGRFNQRGLNIVTLLIPGALGGCLMAFLPGENKVGKLIGNYLTNCIGSSLPLLYSWVAANIAGHTKKVTMNAILLISFCLGNIIGPLTFRQEDAPDFIPAKIVIVVTCVVAAGLALLLRMYYMWENKRRDKKGVERVPDSEFLDLTDRENKRFRYSL